MKHNLTGVFLLPNPFFFPMQTEPKSHPTFTPYNALKFLKFSVGHDTRHHPKNLSELTATPFKKLKTIMRPHFIKPSSVGKWNKIISYIYQIREHVPEGRHPVMSTVDLSWSNINLSFLRIAHCPKKHSNFSRLKRASSFLPLLKGQIP